MKTRKDMPVSPANDNDNSEKNDRQDNLPRSSAVDPSSRESHLKKGPRKKIPTSTAVEEEHPLSQEEQPRSSKSKGRSQLRTSEEIDNLAPLDSDVLSSNGPTTPVNSGNTESTVRRTRSLGRGENRRSKDITRSGSKKCTSGVSKILLCASGGDHRSSSSLGSTASESQSKRKEVDENNPSSLNPQDGSSVLTHRGRKASRKGSSKKKSKEIIPLNTLEDRGEDARPATDSIDNNADNNAKDGKTSQNSNKSCCFCWCCCCSCSCLSGLLSANGKGSKEANKIEVSSLEHFFSGSDDQIPSQEEIKSWGESFDKLMKCPWGRKVFRDFLRCEYSEENILFWLACEDLKNESDANVIEEKCRVIYEDYISILSPKEVSLDSRVREIINKNMMNPSKETFVEAQLQIYTLMHRDSYPRFVNSSNFKQLLDQPPQSPHSGQESS